MTPSTRETTSAPSLELWVRIAAPGAVVVLAVLMISWGLGEFSLIHGDEAVYSLVSRDIYRTGQWLVPGLEGEVFLMKAPLTLWGTALIYGLFGVSELSTRLLPALSAVLAVLVTYSLAWRLFRSRSAGLIAGLVLALNPVFLHVHCARNGETDAPMLLFLLIAGYAFWISLERSSGLWLVVCAVSVGLMAMCKSLAVVALPLSVFALTLLCLGRLRSFTWRSWVGAVLAFGLVVGPWHLLAYSEHGTQFLTEYLSSQTVARIQVSDAVRGYEWGPRRSLIDLHPFSILLCLSPWLLLARGQRPVRAAGLFLLIWVGMAMAAALSVEPRLPWYIIPAYPAAACLIGGTVLELSRISPRIAWPVALLSVGLALGWTIDPGFDPYRSSAAVAARAIRLTQAALPGLAAIFAGASMGVVFFVFLKRRRGGLSSASVAAMSATSTALLCAAVQAARPLAFLPFQSRVDALTTQLQPQRPEGRALYFGRVLPTLAERWYLDLTHSSDARNLEYFCDRREDFLRRAADPDVALLMLPATELAAVREDLKSHWRVFDSVPTACASLPASPHQRLVFLTARESGSSSAFEDEMAKLRKDLRSGSSLNVRIDAAVQLAVAGDRSSTRDILKLDLQDPAALSTVLSALQWMNDPAVIADLRPFLKHKNTNRQIQVLTTQAMLGDRSAAVRLRNGLGLQPPPGESHVQGTRPTVNAALSVLFADDFLATCSLLIEARVHPEAAIEMVYTLAGKERTLLNIRALLEAPETELRSLAISLLTRPDSRMLQLTESEKRQYMDLLDDASRHGDPELRQAAQAARDAFNPEVWSGAAWMRDLQG